MSTHSPAPVNPSAFTFVLSGNILTTTDRLFQYREVDDAADAPTKETLRYRRALLEGFQTLRERPLVTRTAEEICSLIKGREMRVRKIPGTALARGGTGGVVCTPPAGEELLRSLLANWERFLHEATDLDPLIRMAVAHYQFEAIHPFTDGNGRTGRVLNSLFFVSEGLLTLPLLCLSRYIIQHKTDYYRLLRAVTQTDAWEDWVMFMLKGVEEFGSCRRTRWSRFVRRHRRSTASSSTAYALTLSDPRQIPPQPCPPSGVSLAWLP